MIRCDCCNSIISTEAKCSVCGLPIIIDAETNADESEKYSIIRRDVVKDYLNALFGNSTLAVVTYEYEIVDNSISEPQIGYRELCKLSDYRPGAKTDFISDYDSIPSDSEFMVTLLVLSNNRIINQMEIPIKPKSVVPRDSIGIIFKDGLKMKIVVNDEKIACSDDFFIKNLKK